MSPQRHTTARLLAAAMAAACATLPVAAAAASTGGAAAPSAPAASKSRVKTTSIATWFGPGFYGKETACGQTLTPSVIGVAHRTLPCGTLVHISYRHRSITVPVLDRGPYSRADWDLTAGAARALAVDGTARIATRIVGVARNTPTLGLPAAPVSSSPL